MLFSNVSNNRKIKLIDLNPHITCSICNGYLINATTITECMHTFCRSCLISHIKMNTSCPLCDVTIHPSQPLKSIKPDQTMQDIVYKLVPGLRESEKRREAEFNQKAGLIVESDKERKSDDKSLQDHIRRFYAGGIRLSEHQHICMESISDEVPSLDRKFMIVPRRSTVLHLKKFVASKILNDIDKWDNVDIYCNGELQGKEHSIEFVHATRWEKHNPILVFQYSCPV